MKISRFTFVLLVTMFLNCLSVYAKTVKDTLVTTDGDRIILTYEISRSEDHYTLRFNNESSRMFSSKYNLLNNFTLYILLQAYPKRLF